MNKCPGNRFWCGAVLLVLLLSVACESEKHQAPDQSGELQHKIDKAIVEKGEAGLALARQIAASSESSTVEASVRNETGREERRRIHKPRPVDLPMGTWSWPQAAYLETPGETVEQFELSQIPSDFAVDADGGLLVATPGEVLLYSRDGGAPLILEHGAATIVQWNHDGTEVVLSGPEFRKLIDWPARKNVRDLSSLEPRGRLYFAPRPGPLWVVSEESLSLDPTEAIRIRLRVSELDPGTGVHREVAGMARLLSEIGTFPTAGTAWGHQRDLYQILSNPAPIMELVDGTDLGGYITKPGQGADVQPCADRNGMLYFIRANRQRDTGVGPSARAWQGSLNDPGSEKLLTAEPTVDIAVSPDGGWLALLVVRGTKAMLLRSRAEQLLERNLDGPHTIMEQERQKALQALDSIRVVYAATEAGATQVEGQFGLEIQYPPDAEHLQIMDVALRKALKEQAGLELSPGFECLGELDAYLNLIDGIWPEEPATVTAIAGLYGDTLTGFQQVTWQLDASLPALSVDLVEDSAPDNMEMLYTLHSPFLVARERLAGRLSLDARARELMASVELPVALVENFQTETVLAYSRRLLEPLGLKLESNTPQAYADAIAQDPNNDLLLLMSWNEALNAQDAKALLQSASLLAAINPWNPRALLMAASAFDQNDLPDAAMVLYEQAGRLAPEDPAVLVDVGKAYFDRNRNTEAKKYFEEAIQRDPYGGVEGEVAGYLEAIGGATSPAGEKP